MYPNYMEPKMNIYLFLESIGIDIFYTHPDENGMSTSNSKILPIFERSIGGCIFISGIRINGTGVEFYNNNNKVNIAMNIMHKNIILDYAKKLTSPLSSVLDYNVYCINGTNIYFTINKTNGDISIEASITYVDLCYKNDAHVVVTSTNQKLSFPWKLKYNIVHKNDDIDKLIRHID